MIKVFWILLFFGSVFCLMSCSEDEIGGEKLAKQYCGSCHLFPDPDQLDRTTWKNHVLPAMGKLLRVPGVEGNPFEETDRIMSRETALIPTADWQKIVDYYLTHAPVVLPQQSRSAITKMTARFDIEAKNLNAIPTNTFLKIDTFNKWIYAASMDSLLNIFDAQLQPVNANRVEGILVDMFFEDPSDSIDLRKGVLTLIGIMNPNDLKTGSAESFTMTTTGKMDGKKIIDTLPRPVQIISTDLDMDGRMDQLVCGFGNKEGSFFWMRNTGTDTFERKVLTAKPGAIRAHLEDLNADGLPDIVALFAQGDEGMYCFINKGHGQFEPRQIMRFSPVRGSTFFEMVDVDGDGRKDIVYTCGDNADYSKVLKNYHGIYIYISQGNFNFKQEYFFPLHGAFKALTRDFDGDGDLDIAAISYFPDKEKQPTEGFVFLEQTSNFHFVPFSIPQCTEGNWITMDAGDIDKDGDEDIVIGSLFLPNEILQSKESIKNKPLFLLLRNNSIRKSR